ncbi:hypothetical protein DACRYDRAFT_28468, partial [Dacryopinax primogenitus]
MQTGKQLQLLFVTMLQHCHPAAPGELWTHFKDHLCDDLLHQLHHSHPEMTQEDALDYGLY